MEFIIIKDFVCKWDDVLVYMWDSFVFKLLDDGFYVVLEFVVI